MGLPELYLADLDAIAGAPPALPLYRRLHALGLRLWVDAGIRDRSSLSPLLDAGITTVVVGLETVRGLAALAEVLDRYGYEPRREGRAIRLGNCPFHALSESHRELVCGMNLALLGGVVEGMEGSDLEARSDPKPGECCVTVAPRSKKG